MPEISWRPVLWGAGLALMLAVPTALIGQTIDTADRAADDSNLTFLFVAIVFGAIAIGGAYAARQRPDAPLTHAIIAALAAFAVVQLISGVRRVVAGEDLSAVAVLFNGTVSATAGLLGGIVADRLSPHR